MTRGYIKKKVTTLAIYEDTNCDCDLRKSKVSKNSFRSHSKISLSEMFYKIFLIILITISCVNCIRHMAQDVSQNSHKSAENLPITSQDHSDEEIDYDGSESDESDLGTFADERVKDFYQQQRKNYSRNVENDEILPQTPHMTTTTNIPQPECSGSCQDRPKLENAALDSIKKHLLMKLGMHRVPNVTNVIKLPEMMLENLCISNKMPIEYCTGKPSVKHIEYQSDEPQNYPDFSVESEVVEEEEDVQYMSIENRIYAFPSKAAKYRHKSHLVFSFGENQESNNMWVHASLNIFVHSRKHLLSSNMRDAANLKYINIEIAEILSSEKHKLTFRDFNITIPEHGDGQYVQLNITDLVAKWWLHHDQSHGITVKITSATDGSKVPNKIVVLDAEDMIKSPYIDILPRDQRKKRSKRSSLKCSRDSTETRCCRRSLQ
ncbi:hypothetical protein PVAND_016223 [Polypedilum vanderplanki]|uniref:TGF-beta propeptide domain-containing protein n=1 Tax=Polypedilum vanderplanki TaxID=319348 RepID=A0A9J6BEH1_POLVA|nr:hypothetical protein PVAND_016223 [Polypedilum vanderplanki]